MDNTSTLLIGYGQLAAAVRPLLPGRITALRRSPVPGCEPVDATDAEAMARLLVRGFDRILVTLAPAERTDDAYCQAYVRPAEVLAQQLDRLGLKPRLVFVSSSSVYGQDAGEWVDEDSPALPATFAGRRLLEAESLLGERAVTARLSGIYGPGRGQLLANIRAGQVSRKLNSWSNRIHEQDAARALVHLLLLDRPAPRYLVTDSCPVPLGELVAALGGPDWRPAENLTGKRLHNQRLLASGFALEFPDWRVGYGL